ncbi:hypothetical protein [Halomonas heilongjiangensis]|uniref:hypothetical protein n=1 Tax=Halomonas heilongjiangensis TaxID=1387883 RepID=UPI0011AF3BA3|nr:hypothetical protein [Halomonas heilongjiangensis]
MLKTVCLASLILGAAAITTHAVAFSFGKKNDSEFTEIANIDDIQAKACMHATEMHEGFPEIPIKLSEYTKKWMGGQGKTVLVTVDYLRETKLGSSGIGTVTCRFDEADIVNPEHHTPLQLLRFTGPSGGSASHEYVGELRDHIKEKLN